MVSLFGGNQLSFQQKRNNFQATPEQIKQAITNKTKAIIINSPNNPTGMYTKEETLEKISRVLVQHPQITIISDEIYEHLLWADESYTNIVNVCPKLKKEQTIIINGV